MRQNRPEREGHKKKKKAQGEVRGGEGDARQGLFRLLQPAPACKVNPKRCKPERGRGGEGRGGKVLCPPSIACLFPSLFVQFAFLLLLRRPVCTHLPRKSLAASCVEVGERLGMAAGGRAEYELRKTGRHTYVLCNVARERHNKRNENKGQ